MGAGIASAHCSFLMGLFLYRAVGVEQRQLFQVNDIVALLRIALGQDGHFAYHDAASLLNQLLGPLLGLVAAVGTLYCVLLGVKFAKAEEPQEREKAKGHLKNAIIGFVLIFVLIVALRIGTNVMIDWVKTQGVAVTDIPTGTK